MVVDANWYSCDIGVISRSGVRTAVGAAAYITGTKLYDRELEASPNYEPSDYTRKGGVEQWFITAQGKVPEWTFDIDALTNEAQAQDTRKNSRTARTGRFSLPSEADAAGREQITHEVADFLAERYGVAVIASVHAPDRHGDDRNWHAHLWFTTREIDENGLGAKTRVLDDKKTGPQEIIRIREAVADIINDYLEDAGIDERVDHRSYKDRGIDRTPMIHLGEAASALERQGIATSRGDRNRAIRESNWRIDQLTGEIAALQAERVRELKSAFLEPELEPAIEDSPISISQEAPEPALSWKEEKALVQDMAQTDVTGAILDPVAAYAPENSFAFLTQEEPAPEAQPPPALEEEPFQAQDPLMSEITKEFVRQIRQYGEIQEYGLGKSWFDKTLVKFANLYYDTVEAVKDTWQEYVVNRYQSRNNDHDKDIEHER
ncbi:hypothetical protein EPA93_03965 [Ktedonosporobacter rubrisoli]|uniref:MobA/MobL protein domain-containing protein n=1 Tax=Ktedonosporobacter rubrisoli TaxID=2509675 RepID=A0A4P6JJH8_KTERU|nr:MobA/MobL family protein [Ktedonosporobacter rubrisoli]QBD75193.1 hypothetical protein EPA93_03965 [Ktedonosporobacter rubrisoli]